MQNALKQHLLLLSLSVFSVSVFSQTYDAVDYFPLELNPVFTYQVTGGSVSQETIAIQSGTVTINGVQTKKALYASDGYAEYYTNNALGLFLHRADEPDVGGPIVATISPPAKLLNPQFMLGDNHTDTTNANFSFPGFGTFPLTYTAETTVEAEEQVTVPTGTYTAVKILSEQTASGNILGTPINEVSEIRYWFVKHLGVVKSHDLITGEISELTSVDSDGDGTINAIDTDDDGDGTPDVNDDFPLDPDETTDTDNDGIGNNEDDDDDGDTVLDVNDAFPLDPTETTDTDNDGVGDNSDAFPNDPTETLDTDNDGVGDNEDAFPNDNTETLDIDGDGIGNNTDTDDDGDTILDINDNCPLISNTDQLDIDSDGQGIVCDPSMWRLTQIQKVTNGIDVTEGLDSVIDVAISPDGKHVYSAAGFFGDAITVFNRNNTNGQLSFVQLIKQGDNGIDTLDYVTDIVISQDGAFVYAVANQSHSLTVFSRNSSTGELTFVESFKDGVSGVDGLRGAIRLVISPDGNNLYVTGNIDDKIAIFDRNTIDGKLIYINNVADFDGLDGVYGITITADGKHLYITGSNDNSISVFSRNIFNGELTFVETIENGSFGASLRFVRSMSISPDDKFVYIASASISIFKRSSITGRLFFVGSINEISESLSLNSPFGISISPDGLHVYIADSGLNAVLVFYRNPISGTLTFTEILKDEFNGITGLKSVTSIVLSSDGRHAYTTGHDDDAITVFGRTDYDGDLIDNINDIFPMDTDNDGINNTIDTDDDDDGMPDEYEFINNLNPLVDDVLLDLDNDGFNNFVEYQAGSDPGMTVETPNNLELDKILNNDPNGALYHNQFGYDIAVDGDYAVVGTGYNIGRAAYIFHRDTSGNWEFDTKLTDPNNTNNQTYGIAVAISGNYILVADSTTGYMYEKDNTDTWNYVGALSTTDGVINLEDEVSISGDTVVIGSHRNIINGFETGAVFVFERDTSGNWSQTVKLIASDASAYGHFGKSVSIDGDTLLVGAHKNESAYVFERDAAGNWNEIQKLSASDGASGDYFGYSVSVDNDMAIVGSLYDDDNGPNSGSAYIFEKDTSGNWIQQKKLVPDELSTFNLFGHSVSVKNNTVIAGAYQHLGSGAVFISQKGATGNWSSPLRLVPPDIAFEDSFGFSVYLSSDTAAIGSYQDDDHGNRSGSAYLYSLTEDTDNDNVVNIFDAFPTDANETVDTDKDGIGNNADLDDDNDKLPDLYELTNGLDPLDATGINGADGDIDGDGNTNLEEYIVDTNANIDFPTSLQLQKLTASDGASTDDFGQSLAMSGNTLLIGAYDNDDHGSDSGSAYIFERDLSGNWLEQQKLTANDAGSFDYFGRSVSLNGDVALIGADGFSDNTGTRLGAAYIFNRDTSGNWIEQQKLKASDASNYDYFGNSVVLDGDVALVGAYRDDKDNNQRDFGAVYVFNRDAFGVWNETSKLVASDGAETDYFGYSISLDNDVAIIGAYQDDDNGSHSGSAYIFEQDTVSGIWNQAAKLTASDGAANDYFGFSVSVDGDTALVGSYRNNGSGAVYVFKRDHLGNWNEVKKLTASDSGNISNFGRTVFLKDDVALIGSTGDVSAYVFNRNSSDDWIEVEKVTNSVGAITHNVRDALSIDGDLVFLGASPDNSSTGAVYSFSLSIADPDGDGVREDNGTDNCPSHYNPSQTDSDNDDIGDVCDDSDNDGVPDSNDAFPNDPNETVDTDGDLIGNNADTDDDGDGLSDTYESSNGLDPLDASGVNGASGDLDGDGYTNLEEFTAGTNPNDNTDFPISGSIDNDFNADSKADILWRNSGGLSVMWLMDGSTISSSSIVSTISPSAWTVEGTGDFNGDGKTDILWRSSGGLTVLWQMDGSTISSSTVVSTISPSAWTVEGTDDFNGDGKSDILWRSSGGLTVLWQMDGGTISSSSVVTTVDATTWTVESTGDFNGDGKADILWRSSGGITVLWEMDGSTISSSSIVSTISPSVWTVEGTNDFDGDGKADILWRNSAGLTVLWEMDGGTISNASVVTTVDATTWTVEGTNDFDGDGKADILWRNSAGLTVLWQMDGGTISSASVITTITSDWVIENL